MLTSGNTPENFMRFAEDLDSFCVGNNQSGELKNVLLLILLLNSKLVTGGIIYQPPSPLRVFVGLSVTNFPN